MFDEITCRLCGCDDSHACVDPGLGPCWWAEPDLCSHCVVKARVKAARVRGLLIGLAVGAVAIIYGLMLWIGRHG